MLDKVLKIAFYGLVICLIGVLYAIFGSETAKACDAFKQSIDNECKYIKCVSWEELEKAIEESKDEQDNYQQ